METLRLVHEGAVAQILLARPERLNAINAKTIVRGQPPADLDALALAIERLSLLVWELRDQIAELDGNPVIAGPKGAVAVDCLLVPRDAANTSALRAAG